jgi:hypothetical protein
MDSQLVLKRAPIGDNQEDYDVLEDGIIVGRIFLVPNGPRTALDVGEWPLPRDPPRSIWIRINAGGCDGRVREVMAKELASFLKASATKPNSSAHAMGLKQSCLMG